MSAAARAAVVGRFDPETQARVLEACYDEAVALSSQSKKVVKGVVFHDAA